MRIGWVTDIHLNFIGIEGTAAFCDSILSSRPDVLLVGGDIAEAQSLESYLLALENRLQVPIYFVLGNHDFYGGSMRRTRESVLELTQRSRFLNWLPATGVVELNKETCLIGHDSWADGRIGDFARSNILLNDYLLIEDLQLVDTDARLSKLNELGDEAAKFLAAILPGVLEKYSKILVLVHVPPFKASCWYEGAISGDEWLPHFTCKAVGDVLVEMMSKFPTRGMTVLCGHTHGSGEALILPNLIVKTGGAIYGMPQLQEIIEID